MARRKSRRKAPARRRTQTINLAGVAEGALIANAITQGVFNADLKTFFMSTTGQSGSLSKTAAGNQVTLRELISGATGGSEPRRSFPLISEDESAGVNPWELWKDRQAK